MADTITKKEGLIVLYALEAELKLYKKNTRGLSALLKDVKESLRFIQSCSVDERTISLIVEEKKRMVQEFVLSHKEDV